MVSSKFRFLGQISLITWAILFVIPQFVTNSIMHSIGVSFYFTAFYWLVHIGILSAAFLIAWKYDHPLAKLALIPFLGFCGYIFFRYIQSYYWIFNPAMLILNLILLAIMGIQLLVVLIGFPICLFTKKIGSKFKATSINRWTIMILIIGLLWGGFTTWSYIGFSQTYTVTDSSQSDFRVSFWGYPSAGRDYSKYNTPELDAELAIYRDLNASFFFPVYSLTLDDPNTRSNLTAVMNELAEWNIEFVCDATPLVIVYDEVDEQWESHGDFLTYYYTSEFNNTVDAIVEWVIAEGFSNFRGISLDIEGPNYGNSSKVISYQAYQAGLQSFQNKIDEFHAIFPNQIINGISMDGTMFDPIDDDYDLDVAQLTVSNELDLNVYGYMTYMTGHSSPTYSNYRYAYYLNHGMQQHGDQFQPWVGWWYDPKTEDDPNVIENPVVYEDTIEQYKIAKSCGAKEVVMAPVRNYIGINQTEGLVRLQALLDIKNDGFESFEIPITNNMRFINDLPMWKEKIFPTYWISNGAIFSDLMMNTPGNWLFWVQLGIGFGVFFLGFQLLTRKNNQKRTQI